VCWDDVLFFDDVLAVGFDHFFDKGHFQIVVQCLV
jgi:hypothetical protein